MESPQNKAVIDFDFTEVGTVKMTQILGDFLEPGELGPSHEFHCFAPGQAAAAKVY